MLPAKQSVILSKQPTYVTSQAACTITSQAACTIPAKQPVLLPAKQPVLLPAKQPVLLPTKPPVLLPTKPPVLPTKQPVLLPVKQPELQVAAKQPVLPFQTVASCSVATAASQLQVASFVGQPSKQSQVSSYTSPDLQILATERIRSLSLASVMQQLHVVKHVVKGYGNCLYHAVAHQAGFIPSNSKGNERISLYLRKVAVDTMQKYPSVCSETKLSNLQWLRK